MVTASLYIGQLFAMQRQQLEKLKEFYVKSLTCACINYFKVALADGSLWRKGIDLTEIVFFSSFKLILHNSSKLSAFVNCLLSVMESWCLNKVFFSDLLWLVDANINLDVSWYTNVCLMKRITIDFLVLFFLKKDTWINLSKIWVKYMDYFSEWMFNRKMVVASKSIHRRHCEKVSSSRGDRSSEWSFSSMWIYEIWPRFAFNLFIS